MSSIVIEVPAELKSLGESLQELVAAVSARHRVLKNARGVSSYDAVEREVCAQLAAVERSAHGQLLSALDVDAPQVKIEGKLYTRVLRSVGSYKTRAGAAAVERSLYREVGVRNGPTVDAVSLRAGVVGEGWLPETARAMAQLLQSVPSREGKQLAQALGCLPYDRSSFDRVGHAVGEVLVEHEVKVIEALSEKLELVEGAHSIAASVDRVSMPMEEPRTRPVGRPAKGAAKRPVARVYRMAYCGTVTVHDAQGEVLMTLRHAAMPEDGPDDMLYAMQQDVLALRGRKRLPLSLLADGASEMWELLDRTFNVQTVGVEPQRRVDFFHLIEKLAPAASVLSANEDEAHKLLKRWRASLLNVEGAAERIVAELERSGREHAPVAGEQPVHQAITYLLNHRGMMSYAAARARGLSIGSGPVEATCKTLVEVRMKRSVSRWKTPTGAHVLKRRALALSDRWHDATDLTLATLRKTVRPLAA